MRKLFCLAIVGLATSFASANLLVNGSFEQPALSQGEDHLVSAGDVPGWTTYTPLPTGDARVRRNTPGSFQNTGLNVLYIKTGSSNSGVYQLAGELQANTTYTLTLDMGSFNGLNHGGYVLFGEFDENGQYLKRSPGAAGRRGGTTDTAAPEYLADPGATNAASLMLSYETGDVVDAGHQIGVFLGVNAIDVSKDVVWDNLVLTAVPEPATMSLLAAGGLAALIRRRKK